MSLFQRPNSPYWYTEVQVRGRRVVRSTGTASRRAAEAYERRLKEELKREALRVGPNEKQQARHAAVDYTVDQMMGRYWLDHGCKLRWADAVAMYAKRIVETLGTIRVSDLDDVAVDRLVRTLEERGQGKVGTNRMISVLRAAHRMAMKRWGCQVRHIDWLVFRNKEPKARVRWITREEATTLIGVLPPHIALIVEFALYTGLRKAEIRSLKWENVNLSKAEVSVQVKGGHWRTVPLSDAALSVIARAPREWAEVFDAKNLRKEFEAGVVRAGISNFHFHDLRHTFATWNRRNGTALEIVQRALGHSSIQVTQKYAHVDDSEVRAASNTISAITPENVVRLDSRRRQFVYFISDGEAIKIGKSTDPERRLKAMQVGHPKPLWLLGTITEARMTEAQAHAKFADHLVRGEWFKSTNAIVRDILAICRGSTKTHHVGKKSEA